MAELMELFDCREAAQKLGMSPTNMRRWIHERRIGTVRIGRLVKIPRSEIARLIREGATPAVRPAIREQRPWPRERAKDDGGNGDQSHDGA